MIQRDLASGSTTTGLYIGTHVPILVSSQGVLPSQEAMTASWQNMPGAQSSSDQHSPGSGI
jgi:hypothetical protein